MCTQDRNNARVPQTRQRCMDGNSSGPAAASSVSRGSRLYGVLYGYSPEAEVTGRKSTVHGAVMPAGSARDLHRNENDLTITTTKQSDRETEREDSRGEEDQKRDDRGADKVDDDDGGG